MERIPFRLSYKSALLNGWTGNAAALAGLTDSAAETVVSPSPGSNSSFSHGVSMSCRHYSM